MSKVKTEDETGEQMAAPQTVDDQKDVPRKDDGPTRTAQDSTQGAAGKATTAKMLQGLVGNQRATGMLEQQATDTTSAGRKQSEKTRAEETPKKKKSAGMTLEMPKIESLPLKIPSKETTGKKVATEKKTTVKILEGQATTEKQEKSKKATEKIPLIVAYALAKLRQDDKKYGTQKFPDNYHVIISRYLFDVALKHTGNDYDTAFIVLFQLSEGTYGKQYKDEYSRLVGGGGINGWDKVQHFANVALIQNETSNIGVSTAISYGKEVLDEVLYQVSELEKKSMPQEARLLIQQFLDVTGRKQKGADPQDIIADLQGMAFALEMNAREEREKKKAEQKQEQKGKGAVKKP